MDNLDQNALLIQSKAIFKPEYHSALPVWLSNATKSEIKGLMLASKILANQGLKKFRPPKKASLNDLAHSTKNLYKVQSQYAEAFNENVQQKIFESEVLKFVKLSALPIARSLRPEFLMFLERWISLDDSDHYQSLVLSLLRGFFSVMKVNTSLPISTTRESFSRKKIERIPIHGRKKFVNEEVRTKLPEIHRYKSVEVLDSRPSKGADMKKHLNRDHKDMIKWVPSANHFKTMYQDEYKVKNLLHQSPPRKDFYTSTSVKLLPDLDPLDRIS